MADVTPIDTRAINFLPYLKSICHHYQQWWTLYTLTDANSREALRSQTTTWDKPFDFGLIVQTASKTSASKVDGIGSAHSDTPDKVERLPVLEGLRKYASNHVLLVGRPGSGKSTALLRLLLEEALTLCPTSSGSEISVLVKLRFWQTSIINSIRDFLLASNSGNGEPKRIPVLVELRFWQTSIIDLIRNFLGRHSLNLDRSQIEKLLFHNQLLLLVDGLNELPSEAARQDIAKLRLDYPQVFAIFTTRDLNLGGDFGIEKKLEMQPLTAIQMQAFVQSHLKDKAEPMLRQLGDRLQEFGQTPLLLWMLCSLFKQTGQIPTNLGGMFRVFTQSYERNLKRDIIPESDRRWWSELLQTLAFAMIHGRPLSTLEVNCSHPVPGAELRVAIPRAEAYQLFVEYLKLKEAQPEGTARKFLDDLLRYHLLQANGQQIEFRHQLIQEYYAAESLLTRVELMSDLGLQQHYLNYLKWTEPLALMLALIEERLLVERIVKLSLEVDCWLGARLAGAVKQEFQEQTVGFVEVLEVPAWLKVRLLGETRSDLAIPALLRLVTDANAAVRGSAVLALGKIGTTPTIPALLRLVTDANAAVCGSAVAVLGTIRSEAALLALLQLMADTDTYVRRSAVAALGTIRSEAVLPALLQLMADTDTYVRGRAAAALGTIRSEAVLPALLQLVADTDCNVRKRAAAALSNIGFHEATPVLLKLLEHADVDVRGSAATALGNIGAAEAIPALLKLLKHADAAVRGSAATALGNIGATEAIPALLKLLKHADAAVRGSAATALGNIGATEAIPALLKLLKHADAAVRGSVATALGDIGAAEAIPALLKLAEDSNWEVRRMATAALGNIRSAAALPTLLQLVEHPNPEVREGAAAALGNVGTAAAFPALLKLLTDLHWEVRQSAICALGDIIKSAAPLPNLLQILALHSDATVRRDAVAALSNIKTAEALPALLQLVEHADADIRRNVTAALDSIGTTAIIPILLKLLEHSNWHMRRTAATALGNIRTAEAVPALLKLLEHSNWNVRRTAAAALGNIGAVEAVPALLKLLEHSDWDVCRRAAEVLSNIAKSHTNTIAHHLPHLFTLIPTTYGKHAHHAIFAIQENCKYYNYKLIQTAYSMKLFFSYAHADEGLRDTLATHLALLKRQSIITTWHDRDITAGTEWAQVIDSNLDTANIILLLISANFLASDYCYDTEMQRALERHHKGEARVIPVLLKPCDWESAPFGKLQALPIAHSAGAKPVTLWINHDEAFVAIAQGIRKAAAEMQQARVGRSG